MNQTNIKVDPNDKKIRLEKFMVKKIVIGIIQGNQFLYLSFRFDYKVSSRFLQCLSLCFPISFSWWVPFIIYFPLNDLDLPLVNHSCLHLSACPIEHPLRLLCALGQPIYPFSGVFSTLMRSES